MYEHSETLQDWVVLLNKYRPGVHRRLATNQEFAMKLLDQLLVTLPAELGACINELDVHEVNELNNLLLNRNVKSIDFLPEPTMYFFYSPFTASQYDDARQKLLRQYKLLMRSSRVRWRTI